MVATLAAMACKKDGVRLMGNARVVHDLGSASGRFNRVDEAAPSRPQLKSAAEIPLDTADPDVGDKRPVEQSRPVAAD
jgi:hypothetical protein